MATTTIPQEQRVTLSCVTWEAYIGIGEYLRDQPIRMTYDRGRLEIMTTSREHERAKKLLARIVEALIDELDIEVEDGGSTTFRREDLERGLEADDCYWIEHASAMAGKDGYDPDIDPPPDLALEVEISRNVINRLPIYASLGIPEVWRYDGTAVQVLNLQPNGTYERSESSRIFPQLPIAELSRFLDQRSSMNVTPLIRGFREWVREQQETGWRAKKPRGRKKK
jgi:Uma2 family endonuclease